ncbi:MAG TPA: serine/threonine-protein kinase [Polyangiaceae bacterium]|nr:serine/threonine-protein kinase [Polyangiaceae bacterium]
MHSGGEGGGVRVRDDVNDDDVTPLPAVIERSAGDDMLHVDIASQLEARRAPTLRERAHDPAGLSDTAPHEAPTLSEHAPLLATSQHAEPGFPQPGSVLEGKYRLSERLASGTMGSVWRAEHLALEVPVAIKFMQASRERDPDVPRRFLREARIASASSGPHVPQVLDFGVAEGRPYMVMELLLGESLARRLRRIGRLSPEQTANVLLPLARALQRVHDLGVVHRDIKPENVFIVRAGEREHPKLLDFGVAKVQKEQFDVSVSRDTAEGEMVGTPHYMSPEQVRGATTVDHRSDVWALGVIAFECLLGYPPFVASGLGNLLLQICTQPLPVPSTFGAVPVGFDAWFARACAHLPDERFPSVLEAASQLQSLCAHGRLEGPKRPAPTSPWSAAWRWIARETRRFVKPNEGGGLRRRIMLLTAASILGGVVVGIAHRGSVASRDASSQLAAGSFSSIAPLARE